ncbi:MAG TPA: hypothetical protein VNK26_00030, partial [Pyrinomonadaceae bacterium]|nr:hypothetical protein [Pyrinomonadaceae bacterium]
YVPLGWYAWLEGYNIEMLLAFDPDAVPVWYNIAANVAYQLAILLALPVWISGLSLLYIDGRIRHEAYDLELAAMRELGEIPQVPDQYKNPLIPAIENQAKPQTSKVNQGTSMISIFSDNS